MLISFVKPFFLPLVLLSVSMLYINFQLRSIVLSITTKILPVTQILEILCCTNFSIKTIFINPDSILLIYSIAFVIVNIIPILLDSKEVLAL